MSLLATVSMIVALATTSQSVESPEIRQLHTSAIVDMELTDQIDLHYDVMGFFGSLKRVERLSAMCTLIQSQTRDKFVQRVSNRFGFERASMFTDVCIKHQSGMRAESAFFELKQVMSGLREEVYCVTTPF